MAKLMIKLNVVHAVEGRNQQQLGNNDCSLTTLIVGSRKHQ